MSGAARQRRVALAPAPSSGALPRGVAGAALVLGAAVLAVVHIALRDTYWDYSEGVYALSAHLIVHGRALYTGFVGAQPPGVFLAGAALLAVHDTLEWLRVGVACLQLGAGLIAGQIVWRITGSRLAALLTPAALLLTPWAVHEHGALTPELVALPLFMGAVLLGSRSRTCASAGVLCGLLPAIKVPYVFPALVLVGLSADWRRSARWALAATAMTYGLAALLAGESFWREVFLAQTQSGRRSLSALMGFWGQAGWNLLGLLVVAAVAVHRRYLARDAPLLRLAAGLAAAMIVTFVTNVKEGTSLSIAVPVEAALVPLAVCGATFAHRTAGSRRLPALCLVGLLFALAQSVSLMAAPGHPVPFLRPGSRPAWGALMTGPELRAAAARARHCPAGVPYSGPPLIAFLAGRPMPAGQPDQFITAHSRTLAAVARRMADVTHRCP